MNQPCTNPQHEQTQQQIDGCPICSRAPKLILNIHLSGSAPITNIETAYCMVELDNLISCQFTEWEGYIIVDADGTVNLKTKP